MNPESPLQERTPEAKQAYHEGLVAGLNIAGHKASMAGSNKLAGELDDFRNLQISIWNGMLHES